MISIIIASLALLFSIFTYVMHDRMLKKQERLLNEYQLRAFVQDEVASKKAVIRAKSVKFKSGQRTLIIYNMGKTKARNLTVSMEQDDKVFDTHPKMPVTYPELLPDASREIILILIDGVCILSLNYTWDDDFGTNNKESQTIDL